MTSDESFSDSFFAAVKSGQTWRVEKLIDAEKPNLQKLRDARGDTGLSAAIRAEQKNVEMCKLLLARGASPDARGHLGRTALMDAVTGRSWIKRLRPIVKLLAASVNVQDESGQTALMFASRGGAGFGAELGNSLLVRALLSLRADAAIVDNHGRTALAYAEEVNKTGKNSRTVRLLQEALLNQAARYDFDKRFSHSFDKNGILQVLLKSN
jgi:ankyrin repeat protein